MSRMLTFIAFAALVVVPWAAAADPPTITAQLSGTAGNAGWFRSNVTITWIIDLHGATIVPPVVGCQNGVISNEGVNPAESCSIETTGGTASSATATIKIDKSLPTVTGGALSRGPDSNGWYNHPVALTGRRNRRGLRDRVVHGSDLLRPGQRVCRCAAHMPGRCWELEQRSELLIQVRRDATFGRRIGRARARFERLVHASRSTSRSAGVTRPRASRAAPAGGRLQARTAW